MWVGEWMAARKNRDQIVLATKYAGVAAPTPEGTLHTSNYGGNGTKSMRLSLEASLKKLQTSYIDVFYLHWWDYTISIPELMHSLNDLVRAGKVNYLAISDTPAWIVAQCNEYARAHALRPFSVYQGEWNAAMRDMERDIVPMAQHNGMAIAPYGVLNQGRFQTEAVFKEREKNNPGRNFVPLSARDKQVSKVLEALANKRGDGTTLFGIALAYVMQYAPYVFPITGARKVEHIKGNIEALSVSLTEDELKEIEAAYEFDPGFPHTFLSGSLFEAGASPRNSSAPGDVWLTKITGNYDWVEAPKALRPALK